MAAAPPKKKSAIDTLVARDQTAVFWFLVSCIVAAGCAWYLVIMSEELKARPPFVVMDNSGSYYVAPGLNYNRMEPMHLHLTDMATEALFEREPEGIVHAARLPFLCNKIGYNILRAKLATEARFFQTQKAYQTVNIASRSIVGTASTVVITQATGTLSRRSVFNNKEQTETYNFTVQFFWRLNPDIRRNKAFPSVIEGMPKYQLEKISDS
jgi:hypothetical protein